MVTINLYKYFKKYLLFKYELIDKGGIKGFNMSNLVTFLIKDEINYEKSTFISNEIVSFCLRKNLGAIFNFLGYYENLIHETKPNLYFSISDDFLQLNSEYLSTSEIQQIETEKGKKEFYKKFSFLDEIYEILIKFKLKNISLIILTDGSINTISELEVVNSDKKITEITYNLIIDNPEKYGYDFPNVIINFN